MPPLIWFFAASDIHYQSQLQTREISLLNPWKHTAVGSQMFCSNCGVATTPGDRFCASCGAATPQPNDLSAAPTPAGPTPAGPTPTGPRRRPGWGPFRRQGQRQRPAPTAEMGAIPPAGPAPTGPAPTGPAPTGRDGCYSAGRASADRASADGRDGGHSAGRASADRASADGRDGGYSAGRASADRASADGRDGGSFRRQGQRRQGQRRRPTAGMGAIPPAGPPPSSGSPIAEPGPAPDQRLLKNPAFLTAAAMILWPYVGGGLYLILGDGSSGYPAAIQRAFSGM